MLLSLALVAVGILLLVVASDQFVVGAARLALALRVSPVLVGAVVIGFGTSAPELLVGVLAAARGELGLAIGSVVGSNIANLTLVAGTAAAIAPLVIASSTLRRELPLSVAGVVLLAVLIPGGLGRLEGAVLLAGLAVASVVIVHAGLRGSGAAADDDEGEPLAADALEFAEAGGTIGGVGGAAARASAATRARAGTRRELLRALVGMAGTVGGAHLLVTGASDVALQLGVSEAIVGLTLVAIGTSLPELVTAIQAARRGEQDLIVGNLLGSNLFNSLGIAGAAVLVGPGTIDDRSVAVLGPLLMVALISIAAWRMWQGSALHRREGLVLVVFYAAAITALTLA